jgi:hypothetical protein
MKVDTAERLTELALGMSDERNEMVRDIQANEPDNELVRLRQAIGRVMWTIYYEILVPTFEEHPSLEPQGETEAGPATEIPQAPLGTRAAASSAPRARSNGPPQRRRSERRRLDKP